MPKKTRSKAESDGAKPSRDHHSVYVVFLRNPKGDGQAGYYVGMTGLDPDQRFENHKAGVKAARVVESSASASSHAFISTSTRCPTRRPKRWK